MKNTYTTVIAFILALTGAMQCAPQPTFELWYKGLKDTPKTPRDKSRYAQLPESIYFAIGTLDDYEQKNINPFNLKPLYVGKRETVQLDPRQGSRLILSDKENPTLDDEVDVYTFPVGKTSYVRLRLLEEGEKAPLTAGPFGGKTFLFGPQTGKFTKTESGYSLKNNVSAQAIDKQRKKIRDLLPYVVPAAPPPPKPAPPKELALPTKKGIYEIINKTDKTLYIILNDTSKPLAKNMENRGTSPGFDDSAIKKGATAQGRFDDSGKVTMYIGWQRLGEIPDGTEVTYYEFPAQKDLFLVAETDYYGKLKLRSYTLCGTTIFRPNDIIERCKKYGVQSWQIKELSGINKGGVLLKSVAGK